MSYYKCKGIVIKGDKVFCDVASNNWRPITYSKSEMGGKSLEQKLFNVFTDLMSGNLQISTLNSGTIKYEYALIKTREYLHENKIDSYNDLYEKQYDTYNKTMSDKLGFDITSNYYTDTILKEKYDTFIKENKDLVEELKFWSKYKTYQVVYEIYKQYLEEEIKGEYTLYSNDYGYIKTKGKEGTFLYSPYMLEKGTYKQMYCKRDILDYKKRNIEVKRYLMSDTETKEKLEKEKQLKNLANEKIQDLEQVREDILSYQNGGELDKYYFEKICKLCNIECKIPKNVYEIRHNGWTCKGKTKRNRKVDILFNNAREVLKEFNVSNLM